MRQTIKEIEVNVVYRWFLGLGFNDKVPHFTTFGENYVSQFKEITIESIFNVFVVFIKWSPCIEFNCLQSFILSIS